MKDISFDYSSVRKFFSAFELEQMVSKVREAHELLHTKKGLGNEYTGWLELPLNFNRDELAEIKSVSDRIREMAEVFIVIGIGGSYLGAKSALGLLKHTFYNQLSENKRCAPAIYFVGNNISPTYLSHLLEIVKDKKIVVNVISKSGTTLEPAISFRIFLQLLQERYGSKGARERIIVTTGGGEGALRKMADSEGYQILDVPHDVGGRYSVLTPVGLLPMAVGGIDIEEVMSGALQGYHSYNQPELEDNPCYQYAAVRNIFYQKGKTLELLASYEPYFYYLTEWWKQLFGESEGKDGKGIFPAGVSFSTDLHSLGQYIQDGLRNLFVTTLWVEDSVEEMCVPPLEAGDDGFDYLTGQEISKVNEKVYQSAVLAHTEGGVPCLQIKLPQVRPFYYGQLVYFMEKACAVSGYLLGVNPFDQPGVETYKENFKRE